MNTSYGEEQPKMQENVAGRKELNEKESRSGKSNTDSGNSGSGPDYQIYTYYQIHFFVFFSSTWKYTYGIFSHGQGQ
jgi:hypothetical protein